MAISNPNDLRIPGITAVPLDLFVDGTPDGAYALRILRAYRPWCEQRQIPVGLSQEETALWESMNQQQEQRVAELDAAIRHLESANGDP